MGEVGGAARADAFQKLQRRRERVGGHPSKAERPKLYRTTSDFAGERPLWRRQVGGLRRLGRFGQLLFDFDRLVEGDADHVVEDASLPSDATIVRATRPRTDAGVKVPRKWTVTALPGRGLEAHSTSTPLVEMLTSVEI